MEAHKPNAVCVPFPAQGHINAMLKLAILLHHKGFFITFVNTEYNHRRLLKSRGEDSLNGLPDFQFETIPDGLPQTDDADSTQDIRALCAATREHCLSPFRDLVVRLNCSEIVPPVTCIVADGAMSFALVAARDIGVTGVSFRPTNAHTLMCGIHVRLLIQKGILPLKDSMDLTNGYLDTTIDWIPTLEDIRLKDFPTHIRTNDINDLVLNFVIEETEKSLEMSSALIFNTFDALEGDVVDALSPTCPPIYTLGPLHLFSKKLTQNGLNLLGASLWKEEPECLQWLDSKEQKSVVYVNFGSITVIKPQQLVEFAWGLASSNKNFLWIIRSDSVVGAQDSTAVLPNAFLEETRDRGLIARWCPQEQVLAHPSVGAFLTHCGWNSMMESLASGVPMICWPFFADQQLNCRCARTKWGAAVEINSNVNRDEVEKIVREFIDGEGGGKMRRKAFEWKEKADAAIAINGTSRLNLDKLVNQILWAKSSS